jgi:hypothetical protein
MMSLLKSQDRIDPQIVISSIGDLLRETVALDPGEVPSRHQELLLRDLRLTRSRQDLLAVAEDHIVRIDRE